MISTLSDQPLRGSNRVVLLYSGGLDSLYSAEILAEEHHEVHLIHLITHRTVGHSLVLPNLRILMKRYPNRIIWNKIDISETTSSMMGHEMNILTSIFRHRTYHIQCISCKIIIFSWAIRYCLDKGIFQIADGASRNQHSGWERPYFQEFLDSFSSEYQIKIIHPCQKTLNESSPRPKTVFTRLLRISNIGNGRDFQVDFLSSRGYNFGWRIGGRYQFIQAICLMGHFWNAFGIVTEPLLSGPNTEQKVIQYANQYKKLCEERIIRR